MSVIKIGIAGTHSTGKSTFVEMLRRRLSDGGVSSNTVADLAVEARQAGFPILRQHTVASTAWIMARGMSLELEAGLRAPVVIVDRPIGDALGYLWAALQSRGDAISTQEREYLEGLVRLHSRSYHRLFVTTVDPSIPIDTSQQRDLDPVFRNMAAEGIATVFETLGLPYVPLPSSGRDEMANQVAREVIDLLRTRR